MEFFRSQKQVLLTIFSNPAYFALFSIIFTGLLILLFWGAPVLNADNEIVGIVKGENFVLIPHGSWTHISPYAEIKTGLNLQ